MAFIRTTAQKASAWNGILVALGELSLHAQLREESFERSVNEEEIWLLSVAVRFEDVMPYLTNEEQNKFLDGFSQYLLYGAIS